jgi:hypothetical protein
MSLMVHAILGIRAGASCCGPSVFEDRMDHQGIIAANR